MKLQIFVLAILLASPLTEGSVEDEPYVVHPQRLRHLKAPATRLVQELNPNLPPTTTTCEEGSIYWDPVMYPGPMWSDRVKCTSNNDCRGADPDLLESRLSCCLADFCFCGFFEEAQECAAPSTEELNTNTTPPAAPTSTTPPAAPTSTTPPAAPTSTTPPAAPTSTTPQPAPTSTTPPAAPTSFSSPADEACEDGSMFWDPVMYPGPMWSDRVKCKSKNDCPDTDPRNLEKGTCCLANFCFCGFFHEAEECTGS